MASIKDTEFLTELMEQVNDAQDKLYKYQGEKTALLKQIKTEFGVDEKNLEKHAKEVEKELEKTRAEFDKKFEAFKEKWSELIEE